MKLLACIGKPAGIELLEDNIKPITQEIFEKVVTNWMTFIKSGRGGHLPEVIFK